MKQFIPENGLYVTFRYNGSKTVMVIANNNLTTSELDVGRFAEMLSAKTQGVEITTNKSYSLLSPITIPAKTVLILDVK